MSPRSNSVPRELSLIRRTRRLFPYGLLVALILYALAALLTQREVGVVGEVAIGPALGRPPAVWVQSDPVVWADGASSPTAGHQDGPLVASQVRPIERISVGGLDLPLAINVYTGGLPDWPARLLWLLTGSWAVVVAGNVGLGGLLIALVHRFLRFHGSDLGATLAALVLASDAGFLFYRKALGGTELALQAAGLLCFWSLWARRWSGGRHGVVGFGVGVGLGLLAKATFVYTLAALMATALLMRWDKPAMRPPLPARWWVAPAPVVLLTAPLWITWLHHAAEVPSDPHIVSHDFFEIQLLRVRALLSGGDTPAREAWQNLSTWAGNPFAFIGAAYKGAAPPTWTPWRAVAWVVVAAGAVLAWRNRHPSPQEALLRFSGVYLLLQVGALYMGGRDLHHLAQATPTLAITAGLALERLASTNTATRSLARLRNAGLLVLPWLGTGLVASMRADTTLASLEVPTFARGAQQDLVGMLRSQQVSRLVVCDYESYGLLEVLTPDIAVEHAWGAMSRASWDRGETRDGVLAQMLRRAEGGHLLVVTASAPMIYTLAPRPGELRAAAAALGLTVTEVAHLPGERARLWAVGRASGL